MESRARAVKTATTDMKEKNGIVIQRATKVATKRHDKLYNIAHNTVLHCTPYKSIFFNFNSIAVWFKFKW